MNAEQLKVIAEGMGYEESIYRVTQVYDDITIPPQPTYNPLTNNDQMVEIMEKLQINLDGHQQGNWWCYAYNEITDEIFEGVGKTINEAVCNAAYEYFKVS